MEELAEAEGMHCKRTGRMWSPRAEARKKKVGGEREELQRLRKGLEGGGGKGSGASGAKGGHSEEACYAWNSLCGV